MKRPDVSWRRGGWRRLTTAWGVALFFVAVHVDAQVQRTFTARYSTNANGDLAQIGNNSQTCSTVTGANAGICNAARTDTPGAPLATDDNGSFDMINANADPNAVAPGLTNSSSADLNLSAGSTVLWAGLYWGARATGAGTPGTILLRTPAMGGSTAVNDELQYMISYTNDSSEGLTNLSINDSTPPFTVRSALTAPAYGLTPAGFGFPVPGCRKTQYETEGERVKDLA